MNFKIWLEASKEAHSWLSPNGEFNPVFGTTNHSNWAVNYLKSSIRNVMDDMYHLKWQRVYYSNKELYSNNELYGPNFKQKAALIDLAIIEKFDRVLYDNGDANFVIWINPDLNSSQ